VCVWEWRKRENVGYEEVYISQIRVQGAKEERKELQQEILEYLTKNYCEEVLLE
jgi:hypothetical protein